MRNAKETLDANYQEMRWRALSLAADLDRIQRATGSESVMTDPRLAKLRSCFAVLLDGKENRADRVQMILSDTTPPLPR